MSRTPKLLLILMVSAAALNLQPVGDLMAAPAQNSAFAGQSQRAALKTVATSAPDIPFTDDESQSEQQLLALANQSRRHAGLLPLKLDRGLSTAARLHAQNMLEARQLSHELQGEPALAQRLGSASHLLLDREGENVALDYDAGHAHEHLMLSPPHRANLLNPAYNVVGLGVVRNGDRLYIVQDFAHALPSYTAAEVKEHIVQAVEHKRRQSSRGELPRRDLPNADQLACSMAQSDTLGTLPVRNLADRFTVLTYTSLHPEVLPKQAYRAISSHNLHSFSVGSCFGRSDTYPTGVYWVLLALE